MRIQALAKAQKQIDAIKGDITDSKRNKFKMQLIKPNANATEINSDKRNICYKS